jgi:hypothetical protein
MKRVKPKNLEERRGDYGKRRQETPKKDAQTQTQKAIRPRSP